VKATLLIEIRMSHCVLICPMDARKAIFRREIRRPRRRGRIFYEEERKKEEARQRRQRRVTTFLMISLVVIRRRILRIKRTTMSSVISWRT
jgi:hypothetical protein